MSKLLENLNAMQKKAVMQTEGPVLVLAGAGSGKTTVLVNRIAYIIEEKSVSPYHILAITFTNKAANEMKERINAMIGDVSLGMWISTFHSTCVRILRRTAGYLEYGQDFAIYDTADSKTVMKDCLKELNMDEKVYPIRGVMSQISKAKDNMMTPEVFANVNKTDFRLSKIAAAYSLYQKKLKNNNAMDFDDLVFNTVRIFMENPSVLEEYQNRFQYILVDEYQDTSNVQYMFISLLAQGSRNICVVGDDDQSIYRFRGANIQNILGFEEEFADAAVIKLEQNYRSTQTILDAANAVIANNKGRKAKALWTENDQGGKIMTYLAVNERDEGRFLAEEIEKQVKGGRKYSDFAVLYRTNAQSRVLEEMLMRNAIPYRVLAGLRFYDRKEIKDTIAYLRVLSNPKDDVSLRRIINEPKRSIGNTTMDKAAAAASGAGIDLYTVLRHVEDYPELLRASAKIRGFMEMLSALEKASHTMPLAQFVERVMRDTGYLAMLEAEDTVESKTRIENLQEFMSVVAEYEKTEEEPTLGGFLENVALVADIDAYDEDQDAVVMMTIHSAKGLEFPVVFLAGLEEGLFPSMRSTSEEDIEEERRLCYVAITRAKQQLYISECASRMLFGSTTHSIPSRFLREIPSAYLEEVPPKTISGAAQAAIRQAARRKAAYEIYKKPEKLEPLAEAVDFKPGDLVEHRKFGQGMVIEAQRFGKDMRLEIAFESVGTKQLMAAFAKLKKLS